MGSGKQLYDKLGHFNFKKRAAVGKVGYKTINIKTMNDMSGGVNTVLYAYYVKSIDDKNSVSRRNIFVDELFVLKDISKKKFDEVDTYLSLSLSLYAPGATINTADEDYNKLSENPS